VGYTGWAVLFICFLAGGTLFFSANAFALRIFSIVKLQEAFKAANKKNNPEQFAEQLAEKSEELILTSFFYRLILNVCILLLLVSIFISPKPPAELPATITSYLLTFIIAMVLFSVFSLAIPLAWAKYAGEKILSRTFKLLNVFAAATAPVLFIFILYDGFVRRLAVIP
jgi:CBS domain containing-hemolysin-like protein